MAGLLICVFSAAAAAAAAANDEIVLALDLGTTNSVAYLVRADGMRPVSDRMAADHGHQATLWPSMVNCNKDEQLVNGPQAQLALRDGVPTITGSKRFVGRMFDHESVQKLLRGTAKPAFEVSKGADGRPQLKLKCSSSSDVAQSPEFFSGAVLHQLRAHAEKQASKAITRVVITVPAYFDSAHKQATHDAARMAGFTVMRLVPEPVAAAVSHTRTVLKEIFPPGKKELKMLVFDWGGGTLDASVLHVTGPGGKIGLNDFRVMSIAGDNMLGGDDLDGALMKHAFDEFKKTTGLDASKDPRARARLKHLAELTKRDLSVKESSGLLNDADFFQGKPLNVVVTRARFETLAEPIFAKLRPLIERTLRIADLDAADIDRILMVGGSCRIPRVQNLLQEIFDGPDHGFQKVHMDGMDTLDTSVGLGAALVAQKLLAGSEEAAFELHDVVPRFLGTDYSCLVEGKFHTANSACTKVAERLPKVRDGATYFEPLIPANAKLPMKKTVSSLPTSNDQTQVSIKVLTGDEELSYSEDYEQLESFSIECGAKGEDRKDKEILTTFDVDANGILRVFAKSKVAQHELHVGHTMYRPRTQEEINEATKLLQERGMAKPYSTASIDLTKVQEVDEQLNTLLYEDMYSEAKALLRESLELVKSKKPSSRSEQEDLEAMARWLEWKLYQHAYLFEPEQLSDGEHDLKKRRGSSGVCKDPVLTDETRLNEFARMVQRQRGRVDRDWWATWIGLGSVSTCTPRELRRAWQAKIIEYHPDKASACKQAGADSSRGECGCNLQIAMRVHAVYDVLRPVCQRNANA